MNISEKISECIRIYNFFFNISEKDHIKTIKRIIESSLSIIKIFICQYFINYQCIEIKRHIYDIQYQIHLKTYKIRVHHKQGPSPYLQFYDNTGTNITYEIMPFVGPNYDFHNIKYTPKDFGYSGIKIEYIDGTIKEIEKDDIIYEQ